MENSGLNGILEPFTSAMPVQCSTGSAIKPTGCWSLCESIMTS